MTRNSLLSMAAFAAVALSVALAGCGDGNKSLPVDEADSGLPGVGGAGGDGTIGGGLPGSGGTTGVAGAPGGGGGAGGGPGAGGATGGSGGAAGAGGTPRPGAGTPDGGVPAGTRQCTAGATCSESCSVRCQRDNVFGSQSCVCMNGRLFCGGCEVPATTGGTDGGRAPTPECPAGANGTACGQPGTPTVCRVSTDGGAVGGCTCNQDGRWVCASIGGTPTPSRDGGAADRPTVGVCPAGTANEGMCATSGETCTITPDGGRRLVCSCRRNMRWSCVRF